MPRRPERLCSSFQNSGESQRQCKVGSGRFSKIREIVVFSGRLRDDLETRRSGNATIWNGID